MKKRKVAPAYKMAGYASDNSKGLSKLEMFTMAAMQGLCANKQIIDSTELTNLAQYEDGEGPPPGDRVAKLAYNIAISTLNELYEDM